MHALLVSCIIYSFIQTVNGHGLLLLYRPKDISNECAFSHRLRYDISYGMGMSDTITLVFRTLTEVDYECSVEIVTESRVYLVVVVKYPNTIGVNCAANKDALTVMKKQRCLRLCDLTGERDVLSPYYTMVMTGRVRFRFLSNSSINSDINANLYQVTATSARRRPPTGCVRVNETGCEVLGQQYCFTTGVVCDGINNCGVTDCYAPYSQPAIWVTHSAGYGHFPIVQIDTKSLELNSIALLFCEWMSGNKHLPEFYDVFDERKTDCGLPVEKLGYAPVVAVISALLCALLAGGHILLRCLPPLANSFFIFNANEDNRLCIDPVYKSPGHRTHSTEKVKRTSLIPVSLTSSSSSSSNNEESKVIAQHLLSLSISGDPSKSTEEYTEDPEESRVVGSNCPRRKNTMRSMAQKFQNKFRRTDKKPEPVHSQRSKII